MAIAWSPRCWTPDAIRPGSRPPSTAVYHALRELMLRTAATRGLDPDRVSFTETLRSARRSVTVTPGSFSPELLARALVMLEQDLLERLLPVGRLRSQPRAVKRKMSNCQLKQAEHRRWPQPTRTGTQAILITRPQPVGPQCNGIASRP